MTKKLRAELQHHSNIENETNKMGSNLFFKGTGTQRE